MTTIVEALREILLNAGRPEHVYMIAKEALAAHDGTQPAAEPVAWRREFEGDESDLCQWLYADEYEPKDDNPNWTPLYAHPAAQPAAEPVALLWRCLNALKLAGAMCDRVPNRAHTTEPDGALRDLGVMVNKQDDGSHGYRVIYDALEDLEKYLTAPTPRKHITDGSECWCHPDVDYIDPETGAKVIVHKEVQ